YKNYGGRGITVCEQWQEKFENFWTDMGPSYKAGLTIERLNNSLGYCKENCGWRTATHQANNRRTNRYVQTPHGKMTISEACKFYGLCINTFRDRIARGVPVAQALIRPGSTTLLIADPALGLL